MSTTTEKQIGDIQGVLGVEVDGVWGPKSQAALDAVIHPTIGWHSSKSSSFADPKDVAAFRKWFKIYKDQGLSDAEATKRAFWKGDNGIGVWGDDTTGATPCCALHKSHIAARWGTWEAGKHKPVIVQANGLETTCVLKDICTFPDRIDLNPGACAALKLEPPILVSSRWRWA